MEDDFSKLSDDELLAMANERGVREPGTLEKIQNFDQGVTKSFETGLQHGVIDFAQRGSMFIRDMADRMGIVDKKQTAKYKAMLAADREIKQNERNNLPNQTAGKIGKVVGQTIPAMMLPGGSLTKLVGSGAVLGAMDNEENRGVGAAVGGMTAGILGGALKTARHFLPERSAEAPIVKRTVGTVTRKQAVEGAGKLSPEARKATDELNKYIPTEDIGTFQDQFVGLLKHRSDQSKRIADKLFSRSLGQSKTSAAKFNFADEAEQFKQLSVDAAQSSHAAVKDVVSKFQDFFQQPRSLSEAWDLVKGSGPIEKGLKSFKVAGAGQHLEALGQIKSSIRQGLERRLSELSPQSFSQFQKAVDISKKRIVDIGNKEITKAIKGGNFDTIISQLKSANGKKVLNDVMNALGPKARPIVESGIIKRAFQKAVGSTGKLNAAKFNQTLKSITESSGFAFTKASRETIDGLSRVITAIEKNPPTEIKADGLIGSTVKRGLELLLDHPIGVKMLTKAPKGTPEDVWANHLISNIVKSGTAAGIKPLQVDEHNMPDFETMDPESLMELAKQRGLR